MDMAIILSFSCSYFSADLASQLLQTLPKSPSIMRAIRPHVSRYLRRLTCGAPGLDFEMIVIIRMELAEEQPNAY